MKLTRRRVLQIPAVLSFCGACSTVQPSSRTAGKIRISRNDFEWMEQAARREIAGCQRRADDGTLLFTPDGVGNYGALWTRDFYYMLQIFDCVGEKKARDAIQYLLDGLREDGVAPDRRQVDGIPVYCAGGLNNPVALPPLDNSAFLVSLVYLYVKHTGDDAFAREALPKLDRTMNAIPRSASGLVWNDPDKPHSPYGFTDTVGKTGDLLFCSLLDWKASRELVLMNQRIGNRDFAQRYQQRMREIETGLKTLIDPDTGLYFAASVDCRQVDVWGNAFAVAAGFPLSRSRKQRIVTFFAECYDDTIEHGQVRHLRNGEIWNRMLIPINPGDYQNGAYWGTPAGWVLKTLAPDHPQLAERMLRDLVEDYRTRGIHEWVNGDRVRLPHYVASITNPLAAVRELIEDDLMIVVDNNRL